MIKALTETQSGKLNKGHRGERRKRRGMNSNKSTKMRAMLITLIQSCGIFDGDYYFKQDIPPPPPPFDLYILLSGKNIYHPYSFFFLSLPMFHHICFSVIMMMVILIPSSTAN